MSIKAIINGKETIIEGRLNRRLIDFLRNDLELTSVKEGCGEGECGACTVLLNGAAVASCTVLLGQIADSEIVTVEGLAQTEDFDKIKNAFSSEGAVQCGYCTPGMIMSTQGLLNKNHKPDENDIKKALEGNLCRCTGYNKIEQAVLKLVQEDTHVE